MDFKVTTNNEEELMKLKEFSEKVSDLMENYATLLRYLRARDGNILKAEVMLRQSVKWREDNHVDSYRSNWSPPKALLDDFIIDYLGLDKDEYPVFYIPLGRWNVRDRIEDGYLKEINYFRFYIFESIIMSTIERSQRTQFVVTVDMDELSFYKISHLETMNMVIRTVQDFDAHYPELLKAAIVINAPFAFPYAFSLVKPWLSSKTMSKINIFNSNKSKWLPALQKTIPCEILPENLI